MHEYPDYHTVQPPPRPTTPGFQPRMMGLRSSLGIGKVVTIGSKVTAGLTALWVGWKIGSYGRDVWISHGLGTPGGTVSFGAWSVTPQADFASGTSPTVVTQMPVPYRRAYSGGTGTLGNIVDHYAPKVSPYCVDSAPFASDLAQYETVTETQPGLSCSGTASTIVRSEKFELPGEVNAVTATAPSLDASPAPINFSDTNTLDATPTQVEDALNARPELKSEIDDLLNEAPNSSSTTSPSPGDGITPGAQPTQADAGCNHSIEAFNIEPITSLRAADRFPFACLAWVPQLFAGLDGSPEMPSVDVPIHHDDMSINMDRIAPALDIARPVITALLVLFGWLNLYRRVMKASEVDA